MKQPLLAPSELRTGGTESFVLAKSEKEIVVGDLPLSASEVELNPLTRVSREDGRFGIPLEASTPE
ncbi:hypothetical protein HAX54_017909, partial [Datura stramonium]|nr:hypothetical protein [Datura stramonium]